MRSPLTRKEDVKLVGSLKTEAICKKYIDDLGINVDGYFQNVKEVEIWECQSTLYRFYTPSNLLGDATFYEQLQSIQGGDYYPKNKWEYSEALECIKPGMKILEVGCGVGHFIEKALCKGAEAHGLELNPAAVTECRNKKLNVDLQLLEDLQDKQSYYDVVLAFQVLEHIPDVGIFIEQCLKVLKPGGLFVFAVPNSNPYIFKYDKYHTLNLPPHHAGLWSSEVVTRLQDFFPLKIVKICHEPLKEYKSWYSIQVKRFGKKNRFIGMMMGVIPRQVYKPVLKLLRNKIHGISMLSICKKNDDTNKIP